MSVGSLEEAQRSFEEGCTYLAQERYSDAVTAFRTSIASGQGSSSPYNNLAVAHYMLGETEAAIGVYREFIEHHPDHPDLWEMVNSMALQVSEAGRAAEALDLYGAFLARFPSHGMALANATTMAKKHRVIARAHGWLNSIVTAERDFAPIGAASGVPPIEFGPTDLDPAAAAEALRQFGFIIVRKAVDPAPFGMLRVKAQNDDKIKAETFCGLDRLLDAAAIEALVPAYLMEVLAATFGHAPQLKPVDCYMRRVTADLGQSVVPFHQDAVAFARPGANVWIPLVRCGQSAPGLQLVRQRIDHALATSELYDFNEIPERVVLDNYQANLEAPLMEPGDAIVFLSSTIHRSFVTQEMVNQRFSLEIRFD